MSGEDAEFPAFDEWVRDVARNNSHAFVRDAEEHIRYGLELTHRLPAWYQWRCSSVETIGELTESAANAAELNRIYWTDQARNIEAYALMSYWCGMELLESAVRTLNARELIPAGVVSRNPTFVLSSTKHAELLSMTSEPNVPAQPTSTVCDRSCSIVHTSTSDQHAITSHGIRQNTAPASYRVAQVDGYPFSASGSSVSP